MSSEPSYFTHQPDCSHKTPSLGWPVQRHINKVWVRNSRSPPICPQKLGNLRGRWSEWTCMLPLFVSVLLCMRVFQHQVWPGEEYYKAEGCSEKFVFPMTGVHAFSKTTQVTMVMEFQEATIAWADYGLWWNVSHHLFLEGPWTKNGFHIFTWLKKFERRVIFHDMWKFYEVMWKFYKIQIQHP